MNAILQKKWNYLRLRFGAGMAAIAGVALISMMLVAFMGVIMRYFFQIPILGGNEIIQILAGVTVMMAIPVTAIDNNHIRVDVLDNFIGRIGRFIGDISSRAFSAFILFHLVVKVFGKTLDAIKYKDTTNLLEFPLWPMYGFVTLGMSLFLAIILIELVLRLNPKGQVNV